MTDYVINTKKPCDYDEETHENNGESELFNYKLSS